MKQKSIVIVAILTVTMLAGVFTTTAPIANAEEDYGDSSETEKEINNNQRGAASGESKNNFCANIVTDSGNGDTPIDVGACGQDEFL